MEARRSEIAKVSRIPERSLFRRNGEVCARAAAFWEAGDVERWAHAGGRGGGVIIRVCEVHCPKETVCGRSVPRGSEKVACEVPLDSAAGYALAEGGEYSPPRSKGIVYCRADWLQLCRRERRTSAMSY